ncbi:N-acetylmuramoyl-L-alanine amidase [Leptolyngbya sp. CCY15150]|uniref:N-acetylmuramoyl-L-alanine amidase n=1 Tax=Leptolyngbya sp. CCY15150 TaxID=2767772 RepID=UPI001951BFEA
MNVHWLLSGMIGAMGAILIALPADAGQIQSWSYDSRANRLVFSTSSGVQPRAQLIFNPTRLVIDLPGTTLGSAASSRMIGTEVAEVRLGQFNSQTARIVIELSPGYVIDPQQVVVQGETPTQWIVQLPTPERGATPTAIAPSPTSSPPSTATSLPAGAATRLENVRVTPDGFFIRTTGDTAAVDVDPSEQEITVDLTNTVLSSQVMASLPVNRYGVSQLSFSQLDTSPPTARITMSLSQEDMEWRASSSSGGVVLLPVDGALARELDQLPSDLSEVPAQASPSSGSLSTIQAIALQDGETQLLIRADGPIQPTSQWDAASGSYQITVAGAQLAERLSGPQLSATSPLVRVRVRQATADTVVIQVEPAPGTQLGDLNQLSSQLAALSINRSDQAIAVPPPNTSGSSGTAFGVQNPEGRVVVVIDPGHGGRDPGAVGRGGIQEKDIVLSISNQVASLLEQQGIMVVMTRQDDREVDLQPRVSMAEQANADLFVSIHANAISLSRPEVNGAETYYYSDSGLRLARVIHDSMLGTGVNDRGIRQARFYVLVNTSMPAVLLETGFVTGEEDARLLADPAFRTRMAEAIANGIAQYVRQNF